MLDLVSSGKDMQLLHTLCQIPAPAGNKAGLSRFMQRYVAEQKACWRVQPQMLVREELQDCILLVFGRPRTAVFAHLDSIRFTVRYGRQLVRIGGPEVETGYRLVGQDAQGLIDCTLTVNKQTGALGYEFNREIERGTQLLFRCDCAKLLLRWLEGINSRYYLKTTWNTC